MLRRCKGFLLAGCLLLGCGGSKASDEHFGPPAPLEEPWYENTPILSVWPVSDDPATRFGLNVNGVWTGWSRQDVGHIHEQGRKAVISMQVIAADPEFQQANPSLMASVSQDIYGNDARVSWYDYEDNHLTLSIQSVPFQQFLLRSASAAAAIGADAVYLDELQTSAVEVSRDRYRGGFGVDEVAAFSAEMATLGFASFADYVASFRGTPFTDIELATLFQVMNAAELTPQAFFKATDPSLKALQDQVFKEYKRFQEQSAYGIMSGLLQQMRQGARDQGSSIAFGANLVGMGAQSGWSPLAGPFWGLDLDFVVFEHKVSPLLNDSGYMFPPRGSFAPTYRLGRALGPGLVAALPIGGLAEYLEGRPRNDTYLALMFSEAVASEGNWGIGYWSAELGWRADLLSPPSLAVYTRFVAENRPLYHGPRAKNAVLVVYTNQGVLADPRRNESFVGLGQALDRLHVQYDVVYSGDDRFAAAPLDRAALEPYPLVFLPNANGLTAAQLAALSQRITAGGRTLAFDPVDAGLVAAGVEVVPDFGLAYRQNAKVDQLQQSLAAVGVEPGVRDVSQPDLLVHAYYRNSPPAYVIHVVNEAYNSDDDTLQDRANAEVTVRRPPEVDASWTLRILCPGRSPMPATFEAAADTLRFHCPSLNVYAVAVFTPPV